MAKQPSKFTHHFATATDGAKLSYYTARPSESGTTVSAKPSVLVIHGAACYALTHAELALALEPFYTVHIASRRGRGRSDTYSDDVLGLHKPQSEKDTADDPSVYPAAFRAAVLATDVADFTTLITATQAQHVLSGSSGSLVALEHLRLLASAAIPALSTYKSLILFEPPFFLTRTADTSASEGFDAAAVRGFERALVAGDVAAAAVESMHAVRLGPTWMPRWLMRMLCGVMFRSQEKNDKAEEARLTAERGFYNGKLVAGKDERGKWVTHEINEDEENGENAGKGISSMAALTPMIRFDFAVVEHMVGEPSRFSECHKPGVKVLCLRGSKSPAYLRDAVDALAAAIPKSRLVEIEGVGHEVMCGSEMRGAPERAVPALREFWDS